jgi:hypothetical protein
LSTFVSDHDFVKAFAAETTFAGVLEPVSQPAKPDQFRYPRGRPQCRRQPSRAAPKSRLDATLQLFRRFPFRAFPAVFLLVFRAGVLAALLDLAAAVFLAGFAADFLTAFFAGVFLLAFAARFKGARFLRGA